MSWYRSYVPRDRDTGGSLYALGEAADVGSPPSPRRPGAPVARPQAISSSSRSHSSPSAKQISTGSSSSASREAAACPIVLPRTAPHRGASLAPLAPYAGPHRPASTAEIKAAASAAEDQAAAAAVAAAAAAAAQARPPEIEAAASSDSDSSAQQQMQQQRSTAPGSSSRPLFPDPLLHWVDCWAGPGLVRRAKRAAAAAAGAAGAAASRSGGGKASRPAASSKPWHQDQQPPDELRQPLLQPEPPAAAQQLQLPRAKKTSDGPPSTKEQPAAATVRSGRLLQSSPSDASLASVSGSSCCDIPCSPRAQRPQLQWRPPQQQQQQQRCVQLQPAGRSKSQHAAAPAVSGGGAPAPLPQALPPQQQPALRWWLLGGVALAGVSAGAVAATYAVFAYLLKASLVSSLAWKAATGVAAAEGMALGGWSCSSVRAGKASAAQSAAELARVTAQAEQEVAALRALLQQKQAEHSLEVSGLAALNERLSLLAGQSLEAVAALQATQAGSAALLETSGAQQVLLLQEVSQLSRGQAQLLALLCDVREDVMGLVSTSEQQVSGSDLAAAVASAGSASAGGLLQGWQAGRSCSAALAGAGDTAGHDALAGEGEEGRVALPRSRSEPGPVGVPMLSGSSSGSSSGSLEADAQAGQSHQGLAAVPEVLALGEEGVGEWPLQMRRLGSVKGKVTAALAATVSETLQL